MNGMGSSIGRAGLRAAAGVLMVALVACGGGDTGTAPSVVATPKPAARLSATFANATWDLSPRGDFTYRLAFDVTVRETAGTGAKLNFLRADFRDAGGRFLERQEAGSNVLARIAGNGTLTDRIAIDFNDGNTSSAVVTLNATDDLGNTSEMTMTILCCG